MLTVFPPGGKWGMTPDELIDNLPEWEKKLKEGILYAYGKKYFSAGRKNEKQIGRDKGSNERKEKTLSPLGTCRGIYNKS